MAEDLQECEQEWVALRMQAPEFDSQAFLPPLPTNSSSRQPNVFALAGAVSARSRFGLGRIKYQKTVEVLCGAGSWEEEQAADPCLSTCGFQDIISVF